MKLVYFLSREVTSRWTSDSIRAFSASGEPPPVLLGGGTYLSEQKYTKTRCQPGNPTDIDEYGPSGGSVRSKLAAMMTRHMPWKPAPKMSKIQVLPTHDTA